MIEVFLRHHVGSLCGKLGRSSRQPHVVGDFEAPPFPVRERRIGSSTEAILSACWSPTPEAAPQRISFKGDAPSPINTPAGCRSHTCYPYAFTRRCQEEPEMREILPGHHPATRSIANATDFAAKLQVPVLMLAGEADMQRGCCLIETARALAAAAAGRPFELVTYPNTQHGFIHGGGHYNPEAYADAMQRTAAKLAQYLGR